LIGAAETMGRKFRAIYFDENKNKPEWYKKEINCKNEVPAL